MSTKAQRRRQNLLDGSLTPKWLRNHHGCVMAQFRRQMHLTPKARS